MGDYIERKKLIESIKNDCPEQVYYTKENAIDCIKSAISEDVAPVRHGRWVKPVPGDGDPYCSECKTKQLYLPYVGYFYSKYCLYCGAKMDAE